MLCVKHKLAQSKYEKQQFILNEIIKYIQTTISSENDIFIEKIKTHSYNLLITLRKKLASIDLTRKLTIEQQYRRICKKSRNQDVNK